MTQVLSSTLTELENDDWGQPPSDAPPYVQKCYALRHVRIGDLDAEGLRLLIGQDVGLKHLMPLALNLLRSDPLTAGRNYPGDLLVSVLGVDRNYFKSNPSIRSMAVELLHRAKILAVNLDEIDREFTLEGLDEAEREFNSQ